jgi:methyl-accepting chemotaxis protein
MTAEIVKEVQEALQLEQQKADRFFFYLLLSHAPFAALIFPSGYDTWWVGISGTIVLLVITILGHFFLQKTVLLRHLYAITLLSYSILFIQVQMGRIEMHFHVFGALAFLLLYRDWKPIITGAGLIAIQHAVFNLCQQYDIAILEIPLKVFNYGTGWDIVTLHAFFVVFESSILVYFSYVFRAGFLRNQIQIRRLDALGEELNRIVQKSWDVSQYLSEDTAKLVSSSATLSGIASESAAGGVSKNPFCHPDREELHTGSDRYHLAYQLLGTAAGSRIRRAANSCREESTDSRRIAKRFANAARIKAEQSADLKSCKHFRRASY